MAMAVTLHHNNFPSLSSSNSWLSKDQHNAGMNVLNLHCKLLCEWGSSKKGCLMHHALLWNSGNVSVGYRKYYLTFSKPKRMVNTLLFASADDGVTVNWNPQASTSTDLEKMRLKLNSSLVDEDFCDGLLQSLYDAARVFELAFKEQDSRSRLSWFSTAWLGVDRNAWEKALSYKQVPAAVASFVNKFEKYVCFTTAIALSGKNVCLDLSSASDISLLMLALTCIAVITKVGPAKVSCSQFFSISTEMTGSLMDILVDLIPISQAYNSVRVVGLHREFLVHFGPRAAACRVKIDEGSEEAVFWVNIAQRQLQKAIDKERIWSRLTTSESIEVLEKDLAIFGFFIALGRSTRCFLSSNGFNTIDDLVEDFIRYLIGGSVLYYPQLSSISSYQLYVEVVCEELDWLHFYPGIISSTKQLHMQEGPPNAEAVAQALDVCSHWMQSFIKYSTWLESPSNVKAAKFLSIGHKKLMECIEELGMIKDKTLEINTKKTVERQRSAVDSTAKVSDSFDEALESVEEAVLRLENFLQKFYVSSASSGKEHLKAACSDLEKLRILKKEAEFLEASFRAKADSLQQDNCIELSKPNEGIADPESSEIRRFEHLTNELIELERRVQRRAYKSETDEDLVIMDDGAHYSDDTGVVQMVKAQKKGNIIEKSFGKLKETGTDVWQGTQLLAIDAATSMGLLRKGLIGDELTEKEKKTLKRTLTDMASVIPIGVLMLLPVTAVGHAAMLAAIKRYVPALIPSTYTPERKIYNYIRYDLKEIAFPSSLPDPPDIKKRRKLTWDERIWVLKRAARLYAASWVRDIGPDLRPNDYKKEEMTDEPNGEKKTTKGKEPSTLEDLAVAARGGMETLRPALQRVYMTRASAYRDALKSFIEGYQEGVQQVMEKKEESKTQEDVDVPKKST
ncbi:LETM1-like [Sesbania bispinosa]|nr:LETM1-like [Sesbania bispinosa]